MGFAACHRLLSGSHRGRRDRLAKLPMIAMNDNRRIDSKILRDFYGISPVTLDLWEKQTPGGPPGFFRFGSNLVCYGQSAGGASHDFRQSSDYDASNSVQVTGSGIYLP